MASNKTTVEGMKLLRVQENEGEIKELWQVFTDEERKNCIGNILKLSHRATPIYPVYFSYWIAVIQYRVGWKWITKTMVANTRRDSVLHIKKMRKIGEQK